MILEKHSGKDSNQANKEIKINDFCNIKISYLGLSNNKEQRYLTFYLIYTLLLNHPIELPSEYEISLEKYEANLYRFSYTVKDKNLSLTDRTAIGFILQGVDFMEVTYKETKIELLSKPVVKKYYNKFQLESLEEEQLLQVIDNRNLQEPQIVASFLLPKEYKIEDINASSTKGKEFKSLFKI